MAVRESLLALLREGPRHGYHLKVEFERATGGRWPLNVGQVYTTLERLERDGLVASDVVDGQRTYGITCSGLEELGVWSQSAPDDQPPPRDELLLKVLMAIELGPDHALDVITRQRSALHELLARQRQSHPRRATTGDGSDVAADLVADAYLMRAEADLRWLDHCEARVLDQGRSKGAK